MHGGLAKNELDSEDIEARTGDILTMPGLPKRPAAEHIDVDENGVISGLF